MHVYTFLHDRLEVNVTANKLSAECIAPFIGCQGIYTCIDMISWQKFEIQNGDSKIRRNLQDSIRILFWAVYKPGLDPTVFYQIILTLI